MSAPNSVNSILAVFQDSDQVLTGEKLANAKVRATIVGQGAAKKSSYSSSSAKKQYKRTIGHRQDYTLKVPEIVA